VFRLYNHIKFWPLCTYSNAQLQFFTDKPGEAFRTCKLYPANLSPNLYPLIQTRNVLAIKSYSRNEENCSVGDSRELLGQCRRASRYVICNLWPKIHDLQRQRDILEPPYPQQQANKVFLTIDLTPQVLEEALSDPKVWHSVQNLHMLVYLADHTCECT
jgi:hypothetical protein